ncbi:protein kinase domain-containing protein [Sorangium sp. So ce1099]|uniref:protein kinase domain-containing protein n=1 Tax=Sorangium sp. So ce1099 TaxID=3133331 RepID=UPI003F5F3B8F
MDPPSLAQLKPDTIFHGRYRVIRSVKAGGMGAVYEVVDEVTDRRRALKVMLPGSIQDPAMRARFAQEARITGGIESDHIVPISDAGIDADSGMPFLVMDLLQGEELATLSARRGPLPPAEVVLYLAQVARALDKMHAAAIVHRDLKPANLFLTRRDDGSPCVKVLDFGLAKVAAQSSVADRTAMVGTPLYMAPEQIRGDGAVGPRADIHALAHVAFTLLVGSPYWLTEANVMPSIYALLQRMAAGLPEPPSVRAARRRNIRLPPAFDAWFLQATAIEPKDRFDRATTAIILMAEALGAPAPSTPPPSAVPPTNPPPSSRRGMDLDDRRAAAAPDPAPKSRRGMDLDDRRAAAPPDSASKLPDPAPKSRRGMDLDDRRAAAPPDPAAKPPDPAAKPVDTRQRDEDLAAVVHEERLRAFLKKEVQRAREQRTRRLSLLLLGVEGLQEIEEKHGRAGVDRILGDLARVVGIYVPEGGLLGRYRRDVLAIVCPGIGRTRASAFAKVLGEKVRQHRFRRIPSMPFRMVIRIGVAHIEEGDVSGHDLLDRATRELHERGE